MEFPQNTKNATAFDPVVPMFRIFPKDPETPIQKKLYTPMFKAALFTIAKCLSVNDWIKKLWYIYTMEYSTAERKKELLLFATAWMELDSIMLSEILQVEKDTYDMISL